MATVKKFEETVVKYKEVLEVMCLAGSYDYILKMAVADVNDYHSFVVNHLSSLTNIANLNSIFILKEIKKEKALEVT